jgi:DnaJ homolog subfamily B member 12
VTGVCFFFFFFGRGLGKSRSPALLLKFDDRASISQAGIKKAYRKVALRLHPDKCDHAKAEDAFKKLSTAFACLSDENARRQYDDTGGRVDLNDPGSAQQHRSPFGGGFGGMPGGGVYGQQMTPEEIFAAFFGGADPFMQQGMRRRGGQQFHFHRQQRNANNGNANNGNAQGGQGGIKSMFWLVVLFFGMNILLGAFSGTSPEFVLDATVTNQRAGYRYSQSVNFANFGGEKTPKSAPTQKGEAFSIPYWVKYEKMVELEETGSAVARAKARRKLEKTVESEWRNAVSARCHEERQAERMRWWRISSKSAVLPHCDLIERWKAARKQRIASPQR